MIHSSFGGLPHLGASWSGWKMDHRWNEPPFLAHPLSYTHYGIAKVAQLEKTQLATGLPNHFLSAYIRK
jgi:hypothetical protein